MEKLKSCYWWKKESQGFEKIDVPNANFFKTEGVACWVEKKESIKVNDWKNDNINPVVITRFAINEIKLLVLIWLVLLNFRIFLFKVCLRIILLNKKWDFLFVLYLFILFNVNSINNL